MEGSSVESALPDAPMVDEAAALPDALSNVDLTASSMSASRPSSRFAVARAALVTKTVRSWSRDDSYKENNDQANEPSAEDDPSQLIAESLILKGLKRRPTRSQTAADFYNSITHLHLDGQGLTGDVECLSVCPNLQVLYLYDNKLTSLRGLGGLKKLTHLYAQNNDIESLDDFTAPPNLQQLFLNGNLLVEVRGLQETRCLAELHLAGQRRSLPPPPPPAATEWALGAPPPPPPPERPRPAPIRFEQDSLFAIAPTLRKLDVSACHLDDDAVELFIVFQELEHLEMPRNCLEHVDRLQQLVSRLPQLRLLKLAGNPLVSKAKFRERVILATPALEVLDGKPIKPHERQFLMSMVMQGQAKGGPPRKPRAPPISEGQAQRDARTLSREGRPPSIDSRPSRPLRFDGLNGDAPPGIGTQPPAERGVRGAALPQGKSSRSAATGSARLYA